MIFAIYFERADRTHVTLAEWHDAVDSVLGVRRVQADISDTDDWIGYFVNPHSRGQQFHDRADRRNDAEVYYSTTDKWHRAFYWYTLPDDQGGVINFEGGLQTSDDPNDPLQSAARRLAAKLNARLADEDHTWYED